VGLTTLLQQPEWEQRLCHSRLRIGCDNQGTIANMSKLQASSWSELECVFRTATLLWRYDVQPDWVWLPRATAEVQLVDELSKQADPHDFNLHSLVFKNLCCRQLPLAQQKRLHCELWGSPTVDLFASAAFHHCDVFVSRFHTPGAAAVDAYSLSWAPANLAALCLAAGSPSSSPHPNTTTIPPLLDHYHQACTHQPQSGTRKVQNRTAHPPVQPVGHDFVQHLMQRCIGTARSGGNSWSTEDETAHYPLHWAEPYVNRLRRSFVGNHSTTQHHSQGNGQRAKDTAVAPFLTNRS